MIQRIVGVAALLGAALTCWAAPSVSWVSTPYYLQSGGQWYVGPQAKGENCVVVKVDVAASPNAPFSGFSWVGTGTGNGTALSHANYALAPNPSGVQIFRAVAADAAGVDSAPIYWVVKTFPGGVSSLTDGVGRPYTISFYDLPISNGARVMPFANNELHDKNLLESVIRSLTGDHSGGKVLEFGKQCHRFSLGDSGNLSEFVNVGNLTVRSSAAGLATLKWNSRNPNGGGFLSFEKRCRSITVDNLQFDAEIGQRWIAGSHLVIRGSNITVKNCRLYRAPGFAIYIGDGWNCQAGEVPDNVHVESNIIAETYSDGIHVASSKNLYIVGNVVSGTTDDAIALINDAYYTGQVGGAVRGYQSENAHVLWNYIERSGSRGIVVQSAIGGVIDHNTIEFTAGYGIEVQGMRSPSGTIAASDCPRGLDITSNSVRKAGWYPEHSQVFVPRSSLTAPYQLYKHGIYLAWFNLPVGGTVVQCTDNTSTENTGAVLNYNNVGPIHFRFRDGQNNLLDYTTP